MQLLTATGMFLAYVALAKLAETLQYTEFRSSPWNPATAIAVIAGLRHRWWSIPVIFAANMTSNLLSWSPFSLQINSLLAVSHVLVFTALPAWYLQHRRTIPRVSVQMVVFIVMMTIILVMISALSRIAILESAFQLPLGATLQFSLAQAVGHAVAILTITPLYFAIREDSRLWSNWQWSDLFNLFWIFANVYFVFGLVSTDEFKFFYLLFLPVIAFALRRGFAGAALSIFLTDLVMIGFLIQRSFDITIITDLHVLMTTLSLTGLVLGASITERQLISDQLQQSQANLLRSSRLSLASEMASALSHELNQPLAAIRAYVRAASRNMEEQGTATKPIIKDLSLAVSEVDGMAALIKSMRQFLNKDSGSFTKINIPLWARDTVKLLDADFRKSGIEIITDMPASISHAHGSYVQLQQVLANLLRNAREASTPERRTTRVLLSANDKSRPGFVEILVTDNGPGIPHDKRDELFKPLHSDKIDGLGLGLSLCSTIVRSHGGEIWLAQSDSVTGTTFAFTVPIATSPPRMAQ